MTADVLEVDGLLALIARWFFQSEILAGLKIRATQIPEFGINA
jgi:hypothetical protein